MTKILNIPPSILLAPFVSTYTLLKFNTFQKELCWPCYSGPEMCLLFFLDQLPRDLPISSNDSIENESKRALLKGLFTRFSWSWKFKGEYSIFRIQFTPNGFHTLLNLPLREFTNKIVDAQTVFGKEISMHCEQLQQTQNIFKMAALTDEFLKKYVTQKKANANKKGVDLISNAILRSNCSVPIEQYAAMAKMSLRNFERKFTKQVGTSPKTFCRLLRFNRAIEIKLMNPEKCWTSIALDCDYYDQMHMIKDFKKFAGNSPTHLFENSLQAALRIENVKRRI
ncbi:helix-turn-helix domain-containing protein [Aequorivita sp. CIP111184]|uniref:helix-turn-helix domain-containing protein n=1 Tax=Aequorivita sp. CIP111184 TaxID=2211356 RepID=UPI000DBC1534|nr:helix-turn-helix domain-containing protein [Aequorivita sp. CIP111184]SRX54798.1 HTH-type transcriptional activator RhaS [Aequorivita sp. CIP111184]